MQTDHTTFSTLDIVKALGIPRERLRDWMTRGFVSPSIVARGQGTRASFSRFDVYGVALFRTLVDNGFSRDVAGSWVRQFLERERDEPEYQQTAYILFRTSMRNGKKTESVWTFARGNWKIDLETGAMDKMRRLSSLPHYKDKGWTDADWRLLQIVNFDVLCKEVDAALKGA